MYRSFYIVNTVIIPEREQPIAFSGCWGAFAGNDECLRGGPVMMANNFSDITNTMGALGNPTVFEVKENNTKRRKNAIDQNITNKNCQSGHFEYYLLPPAVAFILFCCRFLFFSRTTTESCDLINIQ